MRKVILGFIISSFLGAAVAIGGIAFLIEKTPPVTLIPELTIGIEDGDENLIFGSISRIDLDGKGNIHILDYKYRTIRIFDKDGAFIRNIAVPAGQGPREATNLGGIAVTPEGTLFVNDRRKIIVYGADGSFVRSFLVDFMISSIGCPGTEEVVAIGPHNGKILHVFDQTGERIDSFGDPFPVPSEMEAMKDMPMFSAPLLFNCAKDGSIFVLNPHQYEISIFIGQQPEHILKGKSELFKPVTQRGRGFFSTAAHIVQTNSFIFVQLSNPDPNAQKSIDVFEADKQIGNLAVKGTPHISDPQGRVYFAETDDFPKIVRYRVVKN